MADAVEAVRQGVQQEASDELVGVEGHDPGLAVAAIVAPSEGDLAVGDADQPGVGDRDPMRVAAEIGQDLGGAAERRLGVNHPLDAPQFAQTQAKAAGSASSARSPKKPSALVSQDRKSTRLNSSH